VNRINRTDGRAGRWQSQQTDGFSLIELMVALALGLIVIAGVLQLFAGSRQTFSSNEGMARLQENVRFALDEIKTSVRGAADFGFCGTRPTPTQHLNPAAGWQQAVFGAQESVMGWEFNGTGMNTSLTIQPDYPTASANSWSTVPRQLDGSTPTLTLPAVFSASATVRPVAGSDIIIVRRLIPIPAVTSDASTTPIDATINLTGAAGLANGDLALVTDCTGADLFRNRSTTGTVLSRAAGGGCGQCPDNQAVVGDWASLHDLHLQVYRVQITAYYVGFNTTREQPGLYRMDLSGCPCGTLEEVVDGVENLQALYGYSLPAAQGGDGKSVAGGNWLTAAQFNDWWPVIGARVALLQRSPDRLGMQSVQRQFNLLGTVVTHPLDANLRHDASATLAFRNRVMFDD